VAVDLLDPLRIDVFVWCWPKCQVGRVPNVKSDDIVDPGDAAIQALLALIAENTHDHEKCDRLIDYILTIPPLTEWPPDCREKLWKTCQFIKSLAEDLRQRGEIHDGGGD
jgi:hypothetical protein